MNKDKLHRTNNKQSILGVWLACKFIGILAPQNHFDFAYFDGQNNFATFTRMKLTTNISKPLFIAVVGLNKKKLTINKLKN